MMPTPDYPIDVLVSYHYYADAPMMRRVAEPDRFRVLGDSGAFSAWSLGTPIDLGAYAAWCREYWERFCWCASLDVIGDPEATFTNWARLRDRHGLLTVPTLHAGADPTTLDRYAAEGVDLVGLGGMAAQGQATRAYRWALHVFRYARDRWPAVRFHLWGVTSRRFLETLPAWSADSSGLFTSAFRFGTIRLFDPATSRMVNVAFRGNEVYRHGPLLRRTYGVDPATIARVHAGAYHPISRTIAISNQMYARWLQTRHQVPPPTMYRSDDRADLIGPRIHIVSTNPLFYRKILEEGQDA